MKRNIKYNIYGLMAGALMFGATSCKDDTFSDFNNELGDEVKVTFNLSPEGNMGTRADGTQPRISDGSKADMLVYAVYDKNGALLDEYAKGKDSKVPASKIVGAGQTAIMTDFPHTITLTLKRGEEYQIAFWAQSSKTNAYDTSNLHKVEVNYSQLTDEMSGIAAEDNSSSTPNNDEWRDAFCRTISITPSNNGAIEQNINLFRPLSQINIATNGYDYEIATRETETKYLYSKIRINRVARYLDVVADRTYTSTTENDDESAFHTPEAFAVIDFGWAPIPAYNYMQEENAPAKFPDYPSYTKWDWEYKPDFVLNRDGKSINKETAQSIYGGEEFLKVHYTKDNADWVEKREGDEYVPYANLSDNYNKDSETFKWLSMCYVLTASTETEPVVVNNIKMWLSTDGTDDTAMEVLNINHVPVQKNWRTNIIGNLLTEENDFTIKLDKAFAGEYSGWNNGDNWKWTGPIADGVYYNGDEDVIEISSREGLIWLQKMVNGKMTVREAANSSMVGQYYQYYNSKGQTQTLNYPGLEKPSDDDLIERILVATHQKTNKNSGWPKNNNFHFTGQKKNEETGKMEDYPANIRLMADIDLSGEEWIPIGFDGRIGEQLGWTVLQDDQYNATDNNVSGRIFYGNFDGNGHTIYNMTVKRFSAKVHDTALQKKGYRTVYTTDSRHPSDNPQWFGRGLFGQIGGNAKITNVRLNNVDIYGCNGVAGIAGIAYGDAIEISNCIIDGGSIIATPMYRGDVDRTDKRRTFARGVYMGGIVGYFNTDGGKVDNNIVRNVYMQAVRRAGGLIGSINQQWMDAAKTTPDEGQGLVNGSYKNQRESRPASISNNRLSNITLVVSSFSTYGEKMEINVDQNDNIPRAGFGYNNGNLEMYSQKFVGGYDQEADKRADIKDIFKNNTEGGVTFAHLPIAYDKAVRTAEIESLPLKYMPMLSSWYSDYINLHDNYHGEPSAHTIVQLHDFKFWSEKATKSGYTDDNTNFNTSGNVPNGGTNFYFPMNVPFDVEIDYVNSSPKAGVFVESVTLDGKGGVGGRSVITPTNLQGEDDCVMYITARNRHQFGGGNYVVGALWPKYMEGYSGTISSNKAPTIIKNVVLRGEPYANTGILLAPNKNLHRVELHNVAIYDVYKTLSLYDWSNETRQLIWPNQNAKYDALTRNDKYATPAVETNLPFMILRDCNLRGYTVPGPVWRYVECFGTTFERGASTGNGELEYTYKTETSTTFNGCYFKAPFIIDMTELPSGKTIKFTDSYATSASTGSNVLIDLTGKNGCNKIVISSINGKPDVKYYKGSTELK